MRTFFATVSPALLILFTFLFASSAGADASMGMTRVPSGKDDGPITVFYPAQAPETLLSIGYGLDQRVAPDAAMSAGNGHLIMISHGSGGSPWVYADLARSLVAAGFVVALPEHHGDNYRDPSHPGPESWALRPAEISRAIDALAREPRFRDQLQTGRVGVYGMSAGGHTALSLAGGQWSPARFRQHCDAHLEQDFQACVGLATRLSGGTLDAVRLAAARAVIDHRFTDETLHQDTDHRVVAVVAAVPFAADFDLTSLRHPAAALALVTARGDRWLTPRFHGERVLEACSDCEHLMETGGGHGSALSPLPSSFTGLEADLLNDPPGYDRVAGTAELDRRVTAFFVHHLLP